MTLLIYIYTIYAARCVDHFDFPSLSSVVASEDDVAGLVGYCHAVCLAEAAPFTGWKAKVTALIIFLQY